MSFSSDFFQFKLTLCRRRSAIEVERPQQHKVPLLSWVGKCIGNMRVKSRRSMGLSPEPSTRVCAKPLLDLGAEQRGNFSASARSKAERNAYRAKIDLAQRDPHEHAISGTFQVKGKPKG